MHLDIFSKCQSKHIYIKCINIFMAKSVTIIVYSFIYFSWVNVSCPVIVCTPKGPAALFCLCKSDLFPVVDETQLAL